MLFIIKKEKAYQLLALIGSALVCLLLFNFLGISPTVRLSYDFVPRAIISGLAASLLALLGYVAIVLSHSTRERVEVRGYFGDFNLFRVLGAALVAGGAEELILRGFIFAPVAIWSTGVALILNAVLSGALYMRTRRDYGIGAIYALHGSFFALLYLSTRSLFVVSLAHFIEECLTSYIRTGDLFWRRIMPMRVVLPWRRNGFL